jgi:hypothetical protein
VPDVSDLPALIKASVICLFAQMSRNDDSSPSTFVIFFGDFNRESLFIFSLGKIVYAFHVRRIFYAFVMGSWIIFFIGEMLFMLFVCVRLFMRFIRVVLTKKNCLCFSNLLAKCIKVK